MYCKPDNDIGKQSLNLTSVTGLFLLVSILSVASENIPPVLGALNFTRPASPNLLFLDVGNLSDPPSNNALNSTCPPGNPIPLNQPCISR